MCAGRVVLAGHGFRSDLAARGDIEELFGLPVVSVRLVDPRFYHLDTALCVIDADTAAYYPGAFDDAGRAAIAAQFSDLIEATEQEAAMLRPQRGQRRASRRARGGGDGPGGGTGRAGLRAGTHRHVRVSQGGRWTQVLHAGTATIGRAYREDDMSRPGDVRAKSTTSELIALSEAYSARNYHPMPVVIATAEGAGSPMSRAAGTSTCSPATRRSTSVIAIRVSSRRRARSSTG